MFVEKRIKLKPEGEKNPKLRENRNRLARGSQKTEKWVGRWGTARHLLSAIKNKLESTFHWLHHSHTPEEAPAAQSMALPEGRLEISAATLSLCFSNAKGCCGTATSQIPSHQLLSHQPRGGSTGEGRVSLWQEPAGVGGQAARLTPLQEKFQLLMAAEPRWGFHSVPLHSVDLQIQDY